MQDCCFTPRTEQGDENSNRALPYIATPSSPALTEKLIGSPCDGAGNITTRISTASGTIQNFFDEFSEHGRVG
jgi:hypothetical protein